MITVENPWARMPSNAKRRIAEWSERDLFWITDIKGSYGFYIQSSEPFDDEFTELSLKGIEIGKRNTESGADFFLILADKEDWEIFSILCRDLISAAANAPNDRKMIKVVEARLQRWQRLLKSNLPKSLPVQTQMGLFSELLCLQNVVAPRIGFNSAIKSWTGPDADKQDFLCDSVAIEIKSYATSKGPNVIISSAQQLWTDKERLYLIAYGLSPSENGQTVSDLVSGIMSELRSDDHSAEILTAKVTQYGFIPELHSASLQKFLKDNIRVYKVDGMFPRIDPETLANQISSLKYVIDLSKCSSYKIQENTLIIES